MTPRRKQILAALSIAASLLAGCALLPQADEEAAHDRRRAVRGHVADDGFGVLARKRVGQQHLVLRAGNGADRVGRDGLVGDDDFHRGSEAPQLIIRRKGVPIWDHAQLCTLPTLGLSALWVITERKSSSRREPDVKRPRPWQPRTP
jgi:hypothetical protein